MRKTYRGILWACLAVLAIILFASPMLSAQTAPATTAPDTGTVELIDSSSAQPKGAHELGIEEIRAEERLKIDDLKPSFFPMIDPYEPINSVLKLERYVFDDKLYNTIDSLTVPSQYLHSSYLRTPVVARLIRGDVLVFLPRFEKNVANWELVISNSLGETVRRVKRKGSPPNVITWDGRDDSNNVINTGEVYDFTFYAYDAIGNQTRIPGRPQRISGMLYEDGNEWIVTIAGDEVFDARGIRLSDNAGRWFDEAANAIKEKFKSEIVVYVYTDRDELSSERAEIVVNELKRRIAVPKDAIKSASRFIAGLQPKFSKIEIHVR